MPIDILIAAEYGCAARLVNPVNDPAQFRLVIQVINPDNECMTGTYKPDDLINVGFFGKILAAEALVSLFARDDFPKKAVPYARWFCELCPNGPQIPR